MKKNSSTKRNVGQETTASYQTMNKSLSHQLGPKCHFSYWIPDWYEGACKRFDAKKLTEELARSGFQWIEPTIKCCHGNCNYPTVVGKFSGHDIIGPLTEAGHEAGMLISVVYQFQCDKWAWNKHPNWRMKQPDGNDAVPPEFLPWLMYNCGKLIFVTIDNISFPIVKK